jgi:hypothetical protein
VSAVDAWAEGHGYRLHPLVAEALSKIQAEHEARAWAEARGYKDQPLVTEAIIKFQSEQAGKGEGRPSGWAGSRSGWADVPSPPPLADIPPQS